MSAAISKKGRSPRARGRIKASSLMRTLNVIGDPWTLQILKNAFLGVHRFQDFQERLGIPRQTLFLRLNQLSDDCVFYKKPQDERRVVYAYKLSQKGLDLFPFILAVWRWHHKWDGAGTLPMNLRHLPCGSPRDPQFVCGDCRRPVLAPEVLRQPGAGEDTAMHLRARKSRVSNNGDEADLNNLAASMIGDRWTILLLYAVMRGVVNYDQLQEEVQISSGVLAARLKKLLALQLLEQSRGESDRRQVIYSLTEKGWDVYPMIHSLIDWGDRWLAGSAGPPEILRHAPCGNIMQPEMVCRACQQPIRFWEIGR
jgi:DNA-binding HxlR family transcriptional regulator